MPSLKLIAISAALSAIPAFAQTEAEKPAEETPVVTPAVSPKAEASSLAIPEQVVEFKQKYPGVKVTQSFGWYVPESMWKVLTTPEIGHFSRVRRDCEEPANGFGIYPESTVRLDARIGKPAKTVDNLSMLEVPFTVGDFMGADKYEQAYRLTVRGEDVPASVWMTLPGSVENPFSAFEGAEQKDALMAAFPFLGYGCPKEDHKQELLVSFLNQLLLDGSEGAGERIVGALKNQRARLPKEFSRADSPESKVAVGVVRSDTSRWFSLEMRYDFGNKKAVDAFDEILTKMNSAGVLPVNVSKRISGNAQAGFVAYHFDGIQFHASLLQVYGNERIILSVRPY